MSAGEGRGALLPFGGSVGRGWSLGTMLGGQQDELRWGQAKGGSSRCWAKLSGYTPRDWSMRTGGDIPDPGDETKGWAGERGGE